MQPQGTILMEPNGVHGQVQPPTLPVAYALPEKIPFEKRISVKSGIELDT